MLTRTNGPAWALASLLFAGGQLAAQDPDCFTPHTKLASQPETRQICHNSCPNSMPVTYTYKPCITVAENRECWYATADQITCNYFEQCFVLIATEDRACNPVPPTPPPPPPPDEDPGGCVNGEEYVEGDGCGSPIVVSARGNRLRLTSLWEGVHFDLDSDGIPELMAWTSPNEEDAFLVLDRNGDGMVDNGHELFGNFTPQPDSSTPNGFLALAVFDEPENGGNGDGLITAEDEIFAQLGFWIDRNHDGVSQPNELQAVSSTSAAAFNLRYRESRRTDGHGNSFRYTSTVEMEIGTDGPPRAYAVDVFFVTGN